eukprot:jgi/Orpsp1_1/1189268/evm.model.d7180000070723.1
MKLSKIYKLCVILSGVTLSLCQEENTVSNIGVNNSPDFNQVISYSDDCIKFNQFMYIFFDDTNVNLEEYINLCCDGQTINCENGKITTMKIDFAQYNKNGIDIDYSTFPLFSRLKVLELKNIYNDFDNSNTLPTRFFELPSLETLNIISSNIKIIPENIPKSPVKTINLEENFIDIFPYQFKKLQNLKVLNISNNKITGSLTNEISEFPVLYELLINNNMMSGELYIPGSINHLHAQYNSFNKLIMNDDKYNLDDLFMQDNKDIESLPPKIKLFKSLRYLNIGGTNIKSLPSTIYELSNLEKIILTDMKYLEAKIIKFGNVIKNCEFNNSNITCYQKGTCESVTPQNGNFTECTESEINDILRLQEIEDKKIEKELGENKKLSSWVKYLIIILIIIIIIIIISTIIFFRLRKHFFKLYTNKEADIVISPAMINLNNSSTINTSSNLNSSSEIFISPNTTVNSNIVVHNSKSLFTGTERSYPILPSYSISEIPSTSSSLACSTSTPGNINESHSIKNQNNNSSNLIDLNSTGNSEIEIHNSKRLMANSAPERPISALPLYSFDSIPSNSNNNCNDSNNNNGDSISIYSHSSSEHLISDDKKTMSLYYKIYKDSDDNNNPPPYSEL